MTSRIFVACVIDLEFQETEKSKNDKLCKKFQFFSLFQKKNRQKQELNFFLILGQFLHTPVVFTVLVF